MTPQAADKIAKMSIDAAINGDLDAANRIYDRLLGKPGVKLEVSREFTLNNQTDPILASVVAAITRRHDPAGDAGDQQG